MRIPTIDNFAEENISKYWHVSNENTCQTVLRFLQMRIPTMDNPAEENIWQILAKLHAEENIFEMLESCR
jgi:hypothetical protein